MSFLQSMFAGAGDAPDLDDFWAVHRMAPRTPSGVQVNEPIAMNLPSVYACVRIISNAVAKLPIDVIRKRGDQRIHENGHPAEIILNERPNSEMTPIVFRQSQQAQALLWGNTYSEVQTNRGGRPIALWPLLSDRTRKVSVNRSDGSSAKVVQTNVNGRPLNLPPERVAHIPNVGVDGQVGWSPIQCHRNTVGLGLSTQEYGSRFFGNDTQSGGFIRHPAELSRKAKDNIRDSFEEQGGLDNAHRLKILDEGMEFQATTIPPEDAQFLGTRTFQVEEIARVFGVPLHLLQNHAKDTSFGAGLTEQSLGFLINTIEPWLIRWEQELALKLLTEAERRAGLCIRHNVGAILRGDAKTRSNFYKLALDPKTGWMLRDEVRALEDLNPLQEAWPNVATLPTGTGTPTEPNPDTGG